MPRKVRAEKAAALLTRQKIHHTILATNKALPDVKTANQLKNIMENTDKSLTVERKGNHYTVADGVTGQKMVFVNFYFVKGSEGPGGSWVLIDTGLKGFTKQIIKLAEE